MFLETKLFMFWALKKHIQLQVRINDTVKVIPLIDNILLADSAKVVARSVAAVLSHYLRSQTSTEKERFAKAYLHKQGWAIEGGR